jgi:hypothetical protein
LRDRLGTVDETGRSKREQILDHLIEVATKWDVKIVGGSADGEVLKVASAGDSVAAARLLYSYDIGKPRIPDHEFALMLAGHIHTVTKDQIEIGLKLLGDELKVMSNEQKRAFWDRCERDPRRFLEAAQAEIEGRERGKLP